MCHNHNEKLKKRNIERNRTSKSRINQNPFKKRTLQVFWEHWKHNQTSRYDKIINKKKNKTKTTNRLRPNVKTSENLALLQELNQWDNHLGSLSWKIFGTIAKQMNKGGTKTYGSESSRMLIVIHSQNINEDYLCQEKKEKGDALALKIMWMRSRRTQELYWKEERRAYNSGSNYNIRTNRTTKTRIQNREKKQLFGFFERQNDEITHKEVWTWLWRGDRKKETESLVMIFEFLRRGSICIILVVLFRAIVLIFIVNWYTTSPLPYPLAFLRCFLFIWAKKWFKLRIHF